jgi:hypothetical protein
LQREQFGETQLTGAQTRKLAETADIRAGEKQTTDITQKQFEDETNRKKLITDAIDKGGQLPATSWTPELRAMLGAIPELKEPLERAGHEREMETFKPQLQAAYATRGDEARNRRLQRFSQMPEYVRQNARGRI